LLSVSEKTGIVDFARVLQNAGYEIVSTGGTQRALEQAKIPVTHVEKITQFPECFGGRLKTIHPLVAGGVLFKRGDKEQQKEAKTLGIQPIDIVVVNLYPFEEAYRKASSYKRPASSGFVLSEEVIEQIDIGGPTLLRSAAKNHSSVTVVCDPGDYPRVMEQIEKTGTTTMELRSELAAKVFTHTAAYDALIAEALSGGLSAGVVLERGQMLRYGENPHQKGIFYSIAGRLAQRWKQLQGKGLSYLNILDSDAAWRMAGDFKCPTAVFVKHANPSGIASHERIEEAFQLAYDTDRLSAFGVIIAINRPCTGLVAKKIIDQKIFTEVFLAPSFENEALDLLKQKPNIRVLEMDHARFSDAPVYRSAFGGMLVQDEDTRTVTESDLTCVTDRKPTPEQLEDLLFAWKAVKHAKSNAIVLAKRQVTVGIGCGQTSRVDSTWIAAKRAGVNAQDAVMASDAFFPFPDAVEEAAKHGVAAIIQPGGSIRDKEVFARANELGLVMVLTGVRGFRH